jgi:hypothetical protein
VPYKQQTLHEVVMLIEARPMQLCAIMSYCRRVRSGWPCEAFSRIGTAGANAYDGPALWSRARRTAPVGCR